MAHTISSYDFGLQDFNRVKIRGSEIMNLLGADTPVEIITLNGSKLIPNGSKGQVYIREYLNYGVLLELRLELPRGSHLKTHVSKSAFVPYTNIAMITQSA